VEDGGKLGIGIAPPLKSTMQSLTSCPRPSDQPSKPPPTAAVGFNTSHFHPIILFFVGTRLLVPYPRFDHFGPNVNDAVSASQHSTTTGTFAGDA
jgi:hypothetical protein